jgi:hypothetical protein
MRIRDGIHRPGNGTVNSYLVADGTDVTALLSERDRATRTPRDVDGLWTDPHSRSQTRG